MSTRTINMIPATWRRSPRPSPWPSLAVTGTLVVLLAAIGVAIDVEPRRAHAARPPRPVAPQEHARVEIPDPLTVPLLRAERWHPWAEALTRMGLHADGKVQLESVVYRAGDGILRVVGAGRGESHVAAFMFEIAQLAWLSEPDFRDVRFEPSSGLCRFEVWLRVNPLLELEERGP